MSEGDISDVDAALIVQELEHLAYHVARLRQLVAGSGLAQVGGDLVDLIAGPIDDFRRELDSWPIGAERGDGVRGQPRGEDAPRAKLTEHDVRAIRAGAAEGQPLRSLAERYGVSFQNVALIVRRATWRHVE